MLLSRSYDGSRKLRIIFKRKETIVKLELFIATLKITEITRDAIATILFFAITLNWSTEYTYSVIRDIFNIQLD